MPEGVFAYSNTHPKYPNLSDTKTTAILKYRKDLRCALSLNHCYQFGDKNQNANLKVEGTDGVIFITLGSTSVEDTINTMRLIDALMKSQENFLKL